MKIESLEAAKRAAFMGAYRGLRQQGWRRAEWNGSCVWRRRDGGEVLRCAIGWLIPDKKLAAHWKSDVVEGLAIDIDAKPDLLAPPLAAWLGRTGHVDRTHFLEYLEVLQGAHDDNDRPRQMRAAFNRIRRECGYPIPE